ncbi:hypothetical protein QH494_06310 [Sphingomonas sp. AR_OL41]|uniref:hypothetical protein n=1 Tax=Sphingomonas sp. AR_OL41 TaxID=3042729 RepID=UPI0024818D7F|nr:hypothetical protein [Sphingomonas sp. AR_OL41]MDH7971792.1 hypothetical protein [Sphingomonas sp. AR_OL41]
MSSKDLYCEEHARLTALAEDEGMPWEAAYEATADAAWDAMSDRLADRADELRQRAKDAQP